VTSWLGVVSADHVQRALAEGVCQVCHGKAGPLKKMVAGDNFIYYSPRTRRDGGISLRSFTAAGTIADDEVYQYEMTPSFKPFRRRVSWDYSFHPVALTDIAGELELTAEANWGYSLRRGLIPLSDFDFERILLHGKRWQNARY